MNSLICYSKRFRNIVTICGWVDGRSGQLSPTRSFRIWFPPHASKWYSLGCPNILSSSPSEGVRVLTEGKWFPLQKVMHTLPTSLPHSFRGWDQSCDYTRLQRKLGNVDSGQEVSDQERRGIWGPTGGLHRYKAANTLLLEKMKTEIHLYSSLHFMKFCGITYCILFSY